MTEQSLGSRGRSLPEVVLFDLDGTVTDPSGDFVVSMRHALATTDVAIPSDDILRSFIGPPLHDTLAALGLDTDGIAAATDAYRQRYRQLDSVGTVVHSGIESLLGELRASGCRLGIATSKPQVIAEKILVDVGLGDAFDTVAGASLDERDADKAQVVAKALGQQHFPDPADVVMVGDRSFDVIGARAHGIETVVVLWGFSTEDEFRRIEPRAVVADAEALRVELYGDHVPGGRGAAQMTR